MSAPQEKAKSDKKPMNVKLIMMLSFAVVNLGVTGYGAFLVYKSTLGWIPPSISENVLIEEALKAEKTHDEHHAESGPLIYTMDKFTVNLDGEPKRTIRIEVNVEMLNKDGFEEVISNDILFFYYKKKNSCLKK